jgi:hypothetical protein
MENEIIKINGTDYVKSNYFTDITSHQLKVWRDNPNDKLEVIKITNQLYLYNLNDVINLKKSLRKYKRKED